MATFNWLKSPLLPSWFSAFGTIAVAVVAFITLGPVIENLKLKQENKKLEDEMKDVKDQINQAKQILEIKKTEAASVKSSLVIAQEVLNSLKDQNKVLASAQKELIESLRDRENERAKLIGELAETKKEQRSYVVESIIIKAKARLPELRGFDSEGLFPLSLFEGNLSWGSGLDSFKKGRDIKNGRDIMTNLYFSREFDLLAEIEARKLRKEITDFMDKHQKVFSEPINVDRDVMERFDKYQEDIFLLELFSESKKMPLELFGESKKMPSEEEVKKTKELIKREIERIKDLIKRLKTAFDEMSKELV